ncbi:MAG: nicotinamide-nucleotide amidohydrolase family protein [Gammaproteobacteria bacterium]|nr:nicotinamide-nucleotide amidohydrolase family protein [Gammaproteobacteria bacterium]MCY4357219.1 nicotinamide-nucleotide amidohydrolase family protein [Gammaproteobacteria bacterium]
MTDSASVNTDKRLLLAAGQVARLLEDNPCFLTTAESCTGGWVAQSLTAIADSSAWFDSGLVSYFNAAKQRLLDVPEELLAPDGPGALSEATLLAMARNSVSNTDHALISVAVSGVAGSMGCSPEKPVDTVWTLLQEAAKAI